MCSDDDIPIGIYQAVSDANRAYSLHGLDFTAGSLTTIPRVAGLAPETGPSACDGQVGEFSSGDGWECLSEFGQPRGMQAADARDLAQEQLCA